MTQTLTNNKRTLIFVNLIITCVATSLLQTALTTALPPILSDFKISVTMGQWLTSAYSLVMAIMMPFVTWGISNIDSKNTADGTALINSLRTIAGAIGTAVFVAIMNYVATNSVASYGENAGIHGLNITFGAMSIVAAVMIVIAFVWIKPASKNKCNSVQE